MVSIRAFVPVNATRPRHVKRIAQDVSEKIRTLPEESLND